jgi:cerevisin
MMPQVVSQSNRVEVETYVGAGVDAYVVDTGVRLTHKEFEGRARYGMNAVPTDGDEDWNGHGTHCAGKDRFYLNLFNFKYQTFSQSVYIHK